MLAAPTSISTRLTVAREKELSLDQPRGDLGRRWK